MNISNIFMGNKCLFDSDAKFTFKRKNDYIGFWEQFSLWRVETWVHWKKKKKKERKNKKKEEKERNEERK